MRYGGPGTQLPQVERSPWDLLRTEVTYGCMAVGGRLQLLGLSGSRAGTGVWLTVPCGVPLTCQTPRRSCPQPFHCYRSSFLSGRQVADLLLPEKLGRPRLCPSSNTQSV